MMDWYTCMELISIIYHKFAYRKNISNGLACGIGHETMVGTICLAMLLCSYIIINPQPLLQLWTLLSVLMI